MLSQLGRLSDIETIWRNLACMVLYEEFIIAWICWNMISLGTVSSSIYISGSQHACVCMYIEEYLEIFLVVTIEVECRGCYRHLVGRDQDAAKHSPMQRTASHKEELSSPKWQ